MSIHERLRKIEKYARTTATPHNPYAGLNDYELLISLLEDNPDDPRIPILEEKFRPILERIESEREAAVAQHDRKHAANSE